MKNPLMRMMLILTMLAAAGLACNLPGSTQALPPTTQPLSTEEVRNLESQLEATLNSPNASGDVTIVLTQDQLNGIIAGQVVQQPEQVLSDPSIVLTGGHLEVYGKVTQNGISADLKVVMKPGVDATGTPKLEIVSISLGGLPVPDVLKNQVETMANNALDNYLAENSSSFKIISIVITEGQMTITGTRS